MGKIIVAMLMLLLPVVVSADPPDAGKQIQGAKDIIDKGQGAKAGSVGKPRETVKDPSTSKVGEKKDVPKQAVSDKK